MAVPVARSSQAGNDISGLSTGTRISRGPASVATTAEPKSDTTIMQIATLSNAPCAAASSSAVTAVRSTHSNGFKSVKNNGVRRKLCGKSADMGENVMIMILPEVLIVGPAADRIEQTDTGGIERYGIV